VSHSHTTRPSREISWIASPYISPLRSVPGCPPLTRAAIAAGTARHFATITLPLASGAKQWLREGSRYSQTIFPCQSYSASCPPLPPNSGIAGGSVRPA
jgi:hypothetical protein